MAGIKKMKEIFTQADLIYSYTREQAIEDRVLIDVTAIAKEAGLKYPVAVTNRVWVEVIKPAKVLRERNGQSEEGRLWDVIWMLRSAITGTIIPIKHYQEGITDIIHYQLYAQMLVQRQKTVKEKVIEYKRREQQLITLKAVCGPGDHMDPVITIMFPEED